MEFIINIDLKLDFTIFNKNKKLFYTIYRATIIDDNKKIIDLKNRFI